jgi:amino-acid N-acetyltransferase
MPIRLRPALPGDFEQVAGLLQASDLPVAGVPESLDAFLVAEDAGALVGAIGLELFGEHALLRSAVVRESARGAGLGTALTEGIIALGEQRGVSTLWLLTTTAEGWFPRFGFEQVTRDDVPETVRASAEFRGACPASAVVMRRAPRERITP